MSKFRSVVDIYRQEGLRAVLSKSFNYSINKAKELFEPKYYDIKAAIIGSDIESINGILIDLHNDAFSPEMKKRLREGDYEIPERNLINKHIQINQSTIDLGAGVGYTTSLIARKTNNSTGIIAVEANKLLIPVIKRTKILNKSNFDILHSAYDPSNDSVRFQIAENFWSSSQYKREDREQSEVVVEATSLKDIIERFDLEEPIQLVVDIEGGEHDLFIGEQNTVQNKVSLIIFEYHEFTNCDFEHYSDILEKNGFERIDSQANVHVYKNSKM